MKSILRAIFPSTSGPPLLAWIVLYFVVFPITIYLAFSSVKLLVLWCIIVMLYPTVGIINVIKFMNTGKGLFD